MVRAQGALSRRESNCPCRKGRTGYRKCVRMEVREQRTEAQRGRGWTAQEKQVALKWTCLGKEPQGRVEGPWVWPKEWRLLRLAAGGTDKALPAWGYRAPAGQDWRVSVVELEAICKLKSQLVPLPRMQQEGVTNGV